MQCQGRLLHGVSESAWQPFFDSSAQHLRIGKQRKQIYFCTIFTDLTLSLVVAQAVYVWASIFLIFPRADNVGCLTPQNCKFSFSFKGTPLRPC